MVGTGTVVGLPSLSERLDAERTRGDTLIVMTERGAPSSVLTPRQLKILASQSTERLGRYGLHLLYEAPALTNTARGEDRLVAQVRLEAGNRVGSVRFVYEREYVDVVIEPKIGSAKFLQILEFCHSGLFLSDEDATVYTGHDETTSAILLYCLRRIHHFLQHVTFRDYTPRFEQFATHPRGRLDLRGYSSTCMPKLKCDRMPCSYFDFSLDVPENQILASALSMASRLASGVSNSSRLKIADMAARGLSLLRGVRPVLSRVEDVDTFRYHRGNERFREIHQLCRVIFAGASVTLNPGRRATFAAFAMNMETLFENYVRRVFISATNNRAVPPKSQLRHLISADGKEIQLDGLLHRTWGNAVIECKYKVIEDAAGHEFDEGSMKNADIFQCVAYACHSEVDANQVFLIYPSVRSDGSAARLASEITAFQRADGKVVPIRVVLVSLTRRPREVVEAMTKLLADLPG